MCFQVELTPIKSSPESFTQRLLSLTSRGHGKGCLLGSQNRIGVYWQIWGQLMGVARG